MTRSEEPFLVTTAGKSPREEQHERVVRYLVMMGARVVFFILAIVLARGWMRAVAVALALVLPWIAVILANGGPKRQVERPSLYAGEPRRELPPS